jgi:flagellar basal-body rod protein FlgB
VFEMDNNLLFDQTLTTAAGALNLRARRHELIISNLANADTPGYKAFDLEMEKAIAAQAGKGPKVSLAKTHPTHMPVGTAGNDHLRPYLVQNGDPNNMRGDGNTVNMEREMGRLAENQLMYKASAQIVAKKFQSLKSVIQGGKR